MQSVTFFLSFLYYSFNYNFCLICLSRLFHVPTISSSLMSSIAYAHVIFIFFNNKNFFWLIWWVTSCKNVLIFLYSCIIPNFRFMILIIIFHIKVNTQLDVLNLTSIGFILIVERYTLLYLLNICLMLSIYTFFIMHILGNFIFFDIVINL